MSKTRKIAGRLLILLLLSACGLAVAQLPLALAERIQAVGADRDLSHRADGKVSH